MKKLIQTISFFFVMFAAVADTIPFDNSFDINDYKGQTYLSFMENTVKPAMDTLARDGYVVRGPEAMEAAYFFSDAKVRNKVDRRWGGLEHVKEIAAQLEGEVVTLDTLPGRIRAIDRSVDQYNLATFIGLASGGGVSIKYAEDNYSLNVHYDETEERSGRSFGVSKERLANDASDKDYLDDLQEYATHSARNTKKFNQTLFEALLNSDTSNYPGINDDGQALLTDFLAVFTAEQARNLMDNSVAPHWDAALLEVTLLATFHAGQDDIKLFYKNVETGETVFTDKTYKQTSCALPTVEQKATMRDYWQFSRNIDNAENCGRSGINVTKSEFRLLGTKITKYVAENNPELLDALKVSIGRESGRTTNVYEALSKFLISSSSSRALTEEKVEEIAQAWVAFLDYSRTEAVNISAAIEAGTL